MSSLTEEDDRGNASVSGNSDDIFKQAVIEHATFLGIDPVRDSKYLWLAEEALLAQLPDEWEQFDDSSGNAYYYNKVTGESVWENPLDEPYRQLFKKLKDGSKVCSDSFDSKVYNVVGDTNKVVRTNVNVVENTKVVEQSKDLSLRQEILNTTNEATRDKEVEQKLNKAPPKQISDNSIEEIRRHRSKLCDGVRSIQFLVKWKGTQAETSSQEESSTRDWVDIETLSRVSPELLQDYCASNGIETIEVENVPLKLNNTANRKLTKCKVLAQEVIEIRDEDVIESKSKTELPSNNKITTSTNQELPNNRICATCSEHKTMNLELVDKIKHLEEEHESFKSSVEVQLEAAVEKANEEGEIRFKAERKRVNDAVKEVHRLSELLSSAESRRALMDQQIADLEMQVERKNQALVEAKKDSSQIRKDVEGGVKAAVQEVRDALNREVELERSRAAAAEEEILSLKARVEHLVSSSAKLSEESTAQQIDQSHKIERLNREVREAKRQCEMLVADRSALESSLRDEQAKREELDMSLSKENSKLLAAQELVESQTRRLDRAEGDKGLLQDMMDKLKEELRGEVSANLELRQKFASMEATLESKHREHVREVADWSRRLEHEKSSHALVMADMTENLERAKSEAKVAVDRVMEHRDSIEKQNSAKDSDELSMAELEDQISSLTAEVEKYKRDLSLATEAKVSLEETADVLRQNMRELEDQFGSCKGELMAAFENKDAAERQVQRITTEKGVVEAALEKVKSELKTEMDSCEQFRKRVGEQEAALDSLKRVQVREMSNSQQQAEIQLRDLVRDLETEKQKLKAAEEEVLRLQAQLVESSKAHVTLSNQEEQMEELTRTISNLESKVAEKQNEIQVQLNAKQSLHEQVKGLKDEVQRKEAIEAKLHQEIFGEKERADDEERRRERIESENKLLEDSIIGLKKQLSEESKFNNELRKSRADSIGSTETYKRESERLKSELQAAEAEWNQSKEQLMLQLEEKVKHVKELETLVAQLENSIKAHEHDGKQRSEEEYTLALNTALENQLQKLQAKNQLEKDQLDSEWKEKLDHMLNSGDKVDRNVAAEELAQAVAKANEAAQQTENRLLAEINKLAVKLEDEKKRRRVLHNKVVDLQGNIRVYCRVRPVLPNEIKSGKGQVAVNFPSEDEIELQQDMGARDQVDMFEFDKVFTANTTQKQVFAEVDALVGSALDGYNVCIFAYGQTGSGKTHTMNGTPQDPGVNIRALEELFNLAEESKQRQEFQYSFKITMLEIYNETIQDLLVVRKQGFQPGSSKEAKLEIRKGDDGLFVPGLTVLPVSNMEDVWEAMRLGTRNRTVGAHNVNEHSSRSHLVFSIQVVGEPMSQDGTNTNRKWVKSKLNLIDLAGSERLTKTAAQGARLEEAKAINKSLSALGNVIGALGTGKRSHVPYRNSKLTYLLQDSLSGASKVLMFVNVSPVVWNAGESLSSLNFAARCRAVVLGQAKKNVEAADTAKLRKTIEDLQTKVLMLSTGTA